MHSLKLENLFILTLLIVGILFHLHIPFSFSEFFIFIFLRFQKFLLFINQYSHKYSLLNQLLYFKINLHPKDHNFQDFH